MLDIFRTTTTNPSAPTVQSDYDEMKDRLDLYERAFEEIKNVASNVSKGDFSARIVNWDEYDQLSETLAALNQSYDLADAFIREASASLQAALRKEYHRVFLEQGILGDLGRGARIINDASAAMKEAEENHIKLVNELAESFEKEVLAAVDSVAELANRTKENASKLQQNSEDNQAQANSVAAAAEQASVNVQTVAAASEELSASVEEIAKQVNRSSQRSSEASESASNTNDTIGELAEASKTIGDVVGLINDIADQTNLLALNATIEAARAGDAGKGFAVVASEVKSLAQQTSTATGDIGVQIKDIQDKTGLSVNAILDIAKVIDELNEIASSIAAATEEQSSATIEISRNIQEASQGTDEVSTSIQQVSQTVADTLEMASELKSSALEMQDQMAAVKKQSLKFVNSIRA
ncbi:methyl-accepting chemotaxis protein [Kordiimonas sp. SCSIO 12610]|uniref:methyl-accepting chemotaxis protein n=1 Tax=Kordiimonas sp. SCSIO 12610 TaxID=2829597 RepID=UPI00210A4BBE|nr:methyl-accepting chemotaxis protein [Kordiimonas sp. SCSIO 12610]UTW55418.1 hypothetical protein KFF44_00555 [Kordiimonas sp. SCSIO 12610]